MYPIAAAFAQSPADPNRTRPSDTSLLNKDQNEVSTYATKVNIEFGAFVEQEGESSSQSTWQYVRWRKFADSKAASGKMSSAGIYPLSD